MLAVNGRKVCSSCKIEKSVTEFSKLKTAPDGYRYRCSACRTIGEAPHREKRLVKGREYSAKNADKAAAESRDWYAKNKRRAKSNAYFRKFGLTLDQIEQILSAQGNRCAICKTGTPTKTGWAVDHDHTTWRVRGVLCGRCNVTLGNVKDSRPILQEMIEYLRRAAVLDETAVCEELGITITRTSECGPEDITPEMWEDFERCLENYDKEVV